jgi:hypothetical protein
MKKHGKRKRKMMQVEKQNINNLLSNNKAEYCMHFAYLFSENEIRYVASTQLIRNVSLVANEH